jgi:PAS domain S-box-containing protein
MTEADFKTFEAVGALVVVLDLDGRIAYWNGPCSELSGYSLEEVRGRPFWDFLLVPEEVEGVKAALAKLPSAEHPTRFAT